MDPLTLVFATVMIAGPVCFLAGWHLRPPKDPSDADIDAYMKKHWHIVNEAETRRKRAMLHDANRRTMPPEDTGERSYLRRMRIVPGDDRRQQN